MSKGSTIPPWGYGGVWEKDKQRDNYNTTQDGFLEEVTSSLNCEG